VYQAMKILFCTRAVSDHGEDTLFDGLCRVLGPDNVLEYPYKPSLHGGESIRYRRYPCMFDWPIIATDTEKEYMLGNDAFDAILVGCGTEYDFRTKGIDYDRFYDLLKKKSVTTPVYLVDMGDLVGINNKLWTDLNARLCFKREYRGRHMRFHHILPLNFSYSEKYIPADINTERTIPAFFAGSLNSYRKDCLRAFEEVSGITPRRVSMSQQTYSAELLKARIGLSLYGFGHDTVRYYEVPAHGAMLLAQRPKIAIDHPFIDGETAIIFDTSKDLRGKLRFLLDHPDDVDRIRLAGYEWLKKYHTNRVRATKLLEYIANA